ncbi:MAG TPA: hypothetical protein VMM36_08865 [Opitutaceae bacterium]|nr:hypothetical protein [Opitutaceae bacterium]
MSATEANAVEPEWDEAMARVRAYLGAHGVASPVLEELSGQIILLARDRATAEPGRHPSALAIESAMTLIDAWIYHIVGSGQGEPAGRRFAHERASVHLAQIPRTWPQHFLSSGKVPAELAARLRSTYVMAGPDLEFSRMASRPIDLGPVSEAAGSTWRTLDKLPLLRAFAIWAIYISLLALAFAAVRP